MMVDARRPSGPDRSARIGARTAAWWRCSAVTVVVVAVAACAAPSTPSPPVGTATTSTATGSSATTGGSGPGRAKLVEIGWDTPGAAYVRDNVRTIEELPFDGIAMTPVPGKTPDMFEDRAWTADDVQLDAFASIEWRRFTDNYLSVRGQSPSGGGWFDDARWDRITGNTQQLSAAVAAAGARGIFLDPEFYYDDEIADSAWRYNATQYPDRDFATVEAQVRRRGEQFMTALQSAQPDVTVVLMFSLGMVYAQAAEEDGDRAPVQYALIPAFVNGMLDTAGPAVRVVDGNEGGYYYRTPQDFSGAADWIRDEGATLLDGEHRARYRRNAVGAAVSPDCAFGLWTGPDFTVCDPGTLSAADRRELLEDNVHAALRTADDVVWFYNESFDLVGPNLTGNPEVEPPEGLDRRAVLDAVTAAQART